MLNFSFVTKNERTKDTILEDEFDTANLLIGSWHVSTSKYEIRRLIDWMFSKHKPHNIQLNSIILRNVNPGTYYKMSPPINAT